MLDERRDNTPLCSNEFLRACRCLTHFKALKVVTGKASLGHLGAVTLIKPSDPWRVAPIRRRITPIIRVVVRSTGVPPLHISL